MYEILPFNFAKFDDAFLLVNEAGVFSFLNDNDFDSFIRYKLSENSSVLDDLESNLFLTTGNIDSAVRKLAARYRSRKEFLRDFTNLHMMVITLRCNQRCGYCQVSSADEDAFKYDMSPEMAQKITDFIFSAPTNNPKIEFQGGEPTINWQAIEATIKRSEQLSLETGKKPEVVICSNLVSITEDQLNFCKDHNICISTSLDGPADIHDKYRVTRFDKGTYDSFVKNFKLSRSILGKNKVSGLMTTTANSLNRMKEIVDEYINLEMDGIFIRSINPYGFAAENAISIAYPMENFVEKYLETLEYILEKNKEVFFPEFFETLLFTRMLTFHPTCFVDLQSPAGAGIAGAIYDYDGSVFPSDEARMLARMGDRHFCLGNVTEQSYKEIFYGKKLQAITTSSCLETTVPCAWCVYLAYCGADPVRNYLESGKENRNMAGTPFCIKHKKILQGLFRIWRNADDKRKAIIWGWIQNNPELAK